MENKMCEVILLWYDSGGIYEEKCLLENKHTLS